MVRELKFNFSEIAEIVTGFVAVNFVRISMMAFCLAVKPVFGFSSDSDIFKNQPFDIFIIL